ncbi:MULTISPECIES: hypothetical protein [unclassified Gilliamella]|uniref:hypothetical protein n=1 Tax=unclassified Gilliamella TaxID=2685620 RepID=UPI0022699A4C|nr:MULTISPECIES: hypothetical protein [unclassified Gilliamella]MCX8602060.1 hypothetical protein [Gilliamella sp. B3722]MCX8611330.1 hypothetical protein [Gilliamella sp. B3891]MCX8613902.1 hypothetical protein [Gilliamella sp. B3773]MCX8621157.1 hypothetical protein [Gilliamella sp. B3892]MCX8623674.1 hypothetical protein [Gilliamella sp. B3759]
MIILIYITYYFFSIMPIMISYRFRKYTISDYHYNKRLKWQRRIMLVFNYVALAVQIIIACELERIVRSNPDYGPLLLSAYIFLIIYTFPISWLESPKEYLKKKKWK